MWWLSSIARRSNGVASDEPEVVDVEPECCDEADVEGDNGGVRAGSLGEWGDGGRLCRAMVAVGARQPAQVKANDAAEEEAPVGLRRRVYLGTPELRPRIKKLISGLLC